MSDLLNATRKIAADGLDVDDLTIRNLRMDKARTIHLKNAKRFLAVAASINASERPNRRMRVVQALDKSSLRLAAAKTCNVLLISMGHPFLNEFEHQHQLMSERLEIITSFCLARPKLLPPDEIDEIPF